MTDFSWGEAEAARLRVRQRELKIPQKAIADATRIPLVTLQRIFSGESTPSEDRLALIVAQLPDTTVDDILVDRSAPPDLVKAPVYDVEVAAGAGRLPFTDADIVDEWFFPRSWVSANFGRGADLRLLKVRGDSQEPELRDGDSVMIDLGANRAREGMHVLRLGDALVVKRIQLQGATLVLKSANPAYDDVVLERDREGDDFEVIGRAVWAGKML